MNENLTPQGYRQSPSVIQTWTNAIQNPKNRPMLTGASPRQESTLVMVLFFADPVSYFPSREDHGANDAGQRSEIRMARVVGYMRRAIARP